MMTVFVPFNGRFRTPMEQQMKKEAENKGVFEN